MDKVKKGRARKKPAVNNFGLPFRIGRFLKKYQYATGPKRKPASRSGPQYPLGIFPYVQPVAYIPPACQQAIYMCRALQVLEYAKNPERYNMKARGKES